MSEIRVQVPEYSVAALQMADEHASQRAVVDVQTALEWARNNGVDLPRSGRLSAINAARQSFGLPKFHVRSEGIIRAAALAPQDPEPASQEKPMKQPETPPAPAKSQPAVVQTTSGQPSQIIRTSAGLRDVLFAEMEALRAGASSPRQAMAVAKLASTIVESVKMEMDFIRLNPTIDGLPAPLQLVKS